MLNNDIVSGLLSCQTECDGLREHPQKQSGLLQVSDSNALTVHDDATLDAKMRLDLQD